MLIFAHACAGQKGFGRSIGTGDGGYLDIVADFAFYVAVPLGFGFAAPANTLPALVLVAAFTLTGISFLAFATLAAKRGVATEAHGRKSFFYNTGLAEGTETILVFVLMCLWPEQFALFAWIYAGLCLLFCVADCLHLRPDYCAERFLNNNDTRSIV